MAEVYTQRLVSLEPGRDKVPEGHRDVLKAAFQNRTPRKGDKKGKVSPWNAQDSPMLNSRLLKS